MNRDINRRRMIAIYQRNMLYAQLVVIAVVAVPIGLWATFGSEPTQMVRISVRNVRVDSDAFTPSRSRPTKRNVGGAPDNSLAFRGQFGIKVSIIPDNPTPAPASRPKPRVHIAELAPVVDSDISVSNDTVGEPGPYVPEDAEYVFDQFPETIATASNIIPCSVLVAVKPEYPFVARDRGKEGAAGLIVCIDETGKVSLFPEDIAHQFREKEIPIEQMTVKVDGQKISFNYVVTLEDPKDFFFAKKVAEILPKWVFAPSVVNGQTVKSLIPIGHAFCLTEDCHAEYTVLRNYKRYAH